MILRALLCSLVLLPASPFAQAQKNVTKPVLTPAPVAPPAPSSVPAAETIPVPGDHPVQGTSTPTSGTFAPNTDAAGSAVTPPPSGGESSTRYIIGPQDTIAVTVWKEPGLSGSFPVRPDGMITLSLVGDLPASGFTPMQLSNDIAGRLKKFINDPSVTVTVLGVHVKEIFVLGEVQHVGALALTADMTPLQAISAAGGLSPYAKAKKIYILRSEQGKQRKILFDYKKAIKNGDEQGVSLSPGDTIVVP